METPNLKSGTDPYRYWDSFRLPVQFYGEYFACTFFIGLTLGGLVSYLPGLDRWGFALLALVPLFNLYCLRERVSEVKASKGPAHWSSSLLFCACLVAPPVAMVVSMRGMEQRMSSKVRQSEAKIALAAIFTAEKSYFTEYHAYASDFTAVGYKGEGARRFYVVGFPYACAPDQKLWTGFEAPFTVAEREKIEAYFRGLRDCRDSKAGFEAYAVGVIRKDGPLDIWKIDEKKEMSNVESGL